MFFNGAASCESTRRYEAAAGDQRDFIQAAETRDEADMSEHEEVRSSKGRQEHRILGLLERDRGCDREAFGKEASSLQPAQPEPDYSQATNGRAA